jgi:VCBS repeat protein
VRVVLALACVSLAGCTGPKQSEGEKLARKHCAACHVFPEPRLLDKKSWEEGVLPQMAIRLRIPPKSLFDESFRNPYLMVLNKPVPEADWQKIVGYYLEHAPDTLPRQSLPAQPLVDPDFFKAGPFVPRLQSSAIITLLKTDSVNERIFVGEAGTNTLRVFDWNRRLRSTLTLSSPPTALIAEKDRVLVLESGILSPNDEPKGRLVQYDFAGGDSLRFNRVLIDSLLRPVFVEQFDFDKDGVNELLICEYGDSRGRLALYKYDGSRYQRQVLDPSPGAIRFEIRDMTGDGAPDIVALFAQGDERIVLFENDGRGRFSGRQRILARFPPVYGSMYFSMHDFNNDGRMDILYVNGDNFDYSRVLKPYHGIRILENDGKNNFRERYFFPVYGAAQAVVADFDKDGDLDILTSSNFADPQGHPERGIMFFENIGPYRFQPYAFTIASSNQWNVMAAGDLNRDGWLDVLVGAMDLASIASIQRSFSGQARGTAKDPILLFENRMYASRSAVGSMVAGHGNRDHTRGTSPQRADRPQSAQK